MDRGGERGEKGIDWNRGEEMAIEGNGACASMKTFADDEHWWKERGR